MCTICLNRGVLLDDDLLRDGVLHPSDGEMLVCSADYTQKETVIDKIAAHIRGWVSIMYNGHMERYYIS